MIKLSIQPASFLYIGICLHDSYIPQRYQSFSPVLSHLPDSPTFYFRAPRLVGTRKLPCRAPFSQMLHKVKIRFTGFYLVLPCETLGGFKMSVSHIEWPADGKLKASSFSSKHSDLPSSYFMPMVIFKLDFGRAEDARLLEDSQNSSLTHGHMNFPAAFLFSGL